MLTPQKVGFIGLGAMGLAMATQVVKAEINTVGYDINPSARDAFKANGGQVGMSVKETAQDADILYLMVVNADQVRTVLFDEGAASVMQVEGVVIVGSTIMPEDARQIAAELAAHNLLMIDAPCSGGVVRASDGTLSVMASGAQLAFDKAASVFDAVSANLFNLGEDVGQGSVVKVINQLLCGVHIAAAAEAIALGVKAGVDSGKLFDVISKSAGTSWMFENRVPHMLDGAYDPPKSAVNIFVKDLDIVLQTGKSNTFPLPLAASAHQMFLMASSAGYGRLDDAAVVKVFEQLADIDVTSKRDSDS